MKLFTLVFILGISLLNATTVTLNTGWNLIGVSGVSTQSLATVLTNKSEVTEVLDFTGAGYRSYNNSLPDQFKVNQPFQSLIPGKGYWINTSSSVDIDIDITAGVIDSSKILVDQVGWNQLAFNANTNIPTTIAAMDYVVISEILHFTGAGYQSYNNTLPDQFKTNQPLQDFVNNTGYWVNVTSIDYDKFLTNALTADPDLTSYTTTNLNDKSILVMENNSGLKTSLITFNSDHTYKEVELTSFSASTLNGSDADINATIYSASLLTSGICGNWNWDGTDLNMTPVDDLNVSQTQMMIAESADGNFTVSDGLGGSSTYKKVVYYGAPIDLSNVTDCQVDSFLLPPSIPGS